MNRYETGWLQEIKERNRYPNGWRETSKPTEAEKAAVVALLEKQRLKLERGKPLTVAIGGKEFGRQHYIRKHREDSLEQLHVPRDQHFSERSQGNRASPHPLGCLLQRRAVSESVAEKTHTSQPNKETNAR